MTRLLHAYRALHEQGFIPIFTDDVFESELLIEACLEAGVRIIEYTLRRRDAHQMIPRIRAKYPELILLVGSVLDDDLLVYQMRKKHPQLMTLDELDACNVDGFVSMLGWTPESINRYAASRIIIPTAMTINEAFFQVKAGAHFIKIIGPELHLVKACRSKPTFDFCPIMITGGMTLERIPQAITTGAVLVGTGFDVLLQDERHDVSPQRVATILRRYMEVTQGEKDRRWPELATVVDADTPTWLDALPHWHPFFPEALIGERTTHTNAG